MKYILITKNGKIMQFYIKAAAETYRAAYGGTIVATFPTKENIARIKETYYG
jgi:hypothetical protein